MRQMPAGFEIVAFDRSEEHYAAAVAIENHIYPDYPSTVEDWKRSDRHRNPKFVHARCLVKDLATAEYVAFGSYGQMRDLDHPQKFYTDVFVNRAFQGRGIGSALYEHMVAAMVPHDPILYDSETRSDNPRGMRFLEDRGFEFKTREFSSKLDLATFDPTTFASYLDRVSAEGFELVTLVELRELDENYLPKLYEAFNEIDQDVPWHDTIVPTPYDEWVRRFNDSPNRIEECFVLARKNGEIAGVTMLFQTPAAQTSLFTGLTGVRRAYRRKGLALAMKVKSLGYARETFRTADGGYFHVTTENEENNPMFKINERIGFVRQPDWLAYRKTIKEEAS